MQITLELPEDIAQGMESKWKDLPRAALESLALEAYGCVSDSVCGFVRLIRIGFQDVRYPMYNRQSSFSNFLSFA